MQSALEAISSITNIQIDTFKLIVAAVFACFPAYIWGYIYYMKQPEPRKTVALSFIAGMVAVAPILLYKLSWQFNEKLEIFVYTEKFSHIGISFLSLITVPLSVILAFMFVGLIEEYAKHFVVRAVDHKKYFHCIDDAIEYSIIASLGFSFIENIMYFYFIWTGQGIEQLFMTFIFRSVFSTFGHILFSGLYGYYYGIAHFSSPIFQRQIKEKRPLLIELLHKITGIRKERLFHQEMVLQGLIVAVVVHAIFNIFLEMGYEYVVLPYLIIGYLVLDYLFEKKEDHINYGNILPRFNQE